MLDLSVKQCPICKKTVHYTTEDGRCEECIGKLAYYRASQFGRDIFFQAPSLRTARQEAAVHMDVSETFDCRLASPEEVVYLLNKIEERT